MEITSLLTSTCHTEHLQHHIDDVFSTDRCYHSQFLLHTMQRVTWKEGQFKYCFGRAWKFVI